MPDKKIPLTLIHNDAAGDADHGRSWLEDMLERAGYEVAYMPYDRSRIAAALRRPAELIAVAGGDGTIAKVAAAARPDGPPIAILPLGTANNLAKSLGVWQPIEELILAWRDGTVRPFYPIDSRGPWGRRRLIEGVGFGAIEEAITELPDKTDQESACRSYANAVLTDDPEHLKLTLDGETLHERFAVLEISTIPLVGPNLRLTPAADPTGRKFAVSFICDSGDEREALAKWIAEPDNGAAVPVSMRAAERATISGKFQRVRIDGGVKTSDAEPDWDCTRPIMLTVAAEPLLFLVPG